MPTYEYLCEACGHEMEEFQSISAKPLKKCPECKKNKLKRLIGTGSGVIFKGSGFWETDYNRSKDYKSKEKSESSSSSDSSKSDKSKSDSGSKAESKKSEPASNKSSSDTSKSTKSSSSSKSSNNKS